jgi:uncharacterized protein (DUF488 family)
VRTLIDVRAFPVSRRHPQFSREPLAATLQEAGIGYEWQGKALGGYRRGPYEEHMRTPPFRGAAAALASRAEHVCLMCAESDPAQCHRSHIADWLVAHDAPVVHLLAAGRSAEHARNPQEALWRDD